MARTDPNADVQNLNRRCAPTKTHGSHENSHVTFELRIGQQIQHRTSHRFWSTLESQLTSDLASLLGMHIGPRIRTQNLHRTSHQTCGSHRAWHPTRVFASATTPILRFTSDPAPAWDVTSRDLAWPNLAFFVTAPKGRILTSPRQREGLWRHNGKKIQA